MAGERSAGLSPVQLEAGWEKPVEGHPDEAGQARSANEHTRKAGGAFAGPKGARSSPCALADSTWVNNLPECGRNAGRPD